MKLGFAGTFDPFTNGHIWVVEEALEMAKHVVIMLPDNPSKKPNVPVLLRKQIIQDVASERGWTNVSVEIVESDYTARSAAKMGITRLIRGIRSGTEFEYESQLHRANVDVIDGVKTIFVIPPPELASLSSSYVKSFMANSPKGWHWIIKRMVPEAAYNQLRQQWLHNQWKQLWDYDTKDGIHQVPYEINFKTLISTDYYMAPCREYHNLDHIVHGLSELDAWYLLETRKLTTEHDLKVLKKAFWFHDAIYTGRSGELSDEESSAQLWERLSISRDDRREVANLIRCTDHLQSHNILHTLKDVLIGADLAILGSPFTGKHQTYVNYVKQIRAEYSHYSDVDYYKGRNLVLQKLLDKARANELFKDPYFSLLYNDNAIFNMSLEIQTNTALLEKYQLMYG